MKDKAEQQLDEREERGEARKLLCKAAALLREIGDDPEDGIDDFVFFWTCDEPDERIDEHFYERLGDRPVPGINEEEMDEEEDC